LVRKGSVMDMVCAFLAVLEAVKDRFISIYQHRMFGDILIKPWIGADGSTSSSIFARRTEGEGV
jgi:segregation and condensation protein A